MYLLRGNSDLIEGKGRMKMIGVFLKFEDAKEIGERDTKIMGIEPCYDIEEINPYISKDQYDSDKEKTVKIYHSYYKQWKVVGR